MDPHTSTSHVINKPNSIKNKSRMTSNVINALTSCIHNSHSADLLSFHFNQRNIKYTHQILSLQVTSF